MGFGLGFGSGLGLGLGLGLGVRARVRIRVRVRVRVREGGRPAVERVVGLAVEDEEAAEQQAAHAVDDPVMRRFERWLLDNGATFPRLTMQTYGDEVRGVLEARRVRLQRAAARMVHRHLAATFAPWLAHTRTLLQARQWAAVMARRARARADTEVTRQP